VIAQVRVCCCLLQLRGRLKEAAEAKEVAVRAAARSRLNRSVCGRALSDQNDQGVPYPIC